MKKIILLLVCCITISYVFSQDTTKINIFDRYYLTNTMRFYNFTAPAAAKMTFRGDVWVSPSASMDVFTFEVRTGKYKIGLIPGIGYGIRYKPYFMTKNYLFALDLFLQGFASDEIETNNGLDYFVIDILPVFSVFNWFGVGYGLRYKIGLEGIQSVYSPIFTIGFKKSI